MRHSPKRIFFFGVAGGISAAIYIGAVWLFQYLQIFPTWLNVAISIVLSKVPNFLMNRNLAFRDSKTGSWKKQFVRFVSSTALGTSLNYLVTTGLLEYSQFFASWPVWAGVIGVAVATGFNYLANVYWVFDHKK
jgi:putative flippase GtrA